VKASRLLGIDERPSWETSSVSKRTLL